MKKLNVLVQVQVRVTATTGVVTFRNTFDDISKGEVETEEDLAHLIDLAIPEVPNTASVAAMIESSELHYLKNGEV